MVATRQQTDGENSGCVWKLFDDDPDSDKTYLKYEFVFKPDLNLNIKLSIFDAAK